MRDTPDFSRGWLEREFLGGELRAFLRYIRRPRLSPRRRRADDYPPWLADWLLACPWRLLLVWAVFLWGCNLLILGPVMLWAADASGAEHALGGLSDASRVPVLLAVFAAPVAEELVFRFGLRRPTQLFWMVPLILLMALASWFFTRHVWPGVALGVALAVVTSACLMRRAARPGTYMGRRAWRWRRVYVRHFGWPFHAAGLAFALVHLVNYRFADALWLAPLLVFPQWLGGLVMGWMRVTRSLGSAIAMHACYNAGPVLLIWAMLKFWPEGG